MSAPRPGQATSPGQEQPAHPRACTAHRPHEGRGRSGWEAAGRQPRAGDARHRPRTRDRGLGRQASRPYHLLRDVDVGLSKGLWQELLPERVHCGGVDSNQGHHACNARGAVTAALRPAQGICGSRALLGPPSCPGPHPTHRRLQAPRPSLTPKPGSCAHTALSRPQALAYTRPSHAGLRAPLHPGCPQPAQTPWAACPPTECSGGTTGPGAHSSDSQTTSAGTECAWTRPCVSADGRRLTGFSSCSTFLPRRSDREDTGPTLGHLDAQPRDRHLPALTADRTAHTGPCRSRAPGVPAGCTGRPWDGGKACPVPRSRPRTLPLALALHTQQALQAR